MGGKPPSHCFQVALSVIMAAIKVIDFLDKTYQLLLLPPDNDDNESTKR